MSRKIFKLLFHWYVTAVDKHPLLLLIVTSSSCLLMIILSLTLSNLPKFDDPQLGFQSRGSILSKRITAWNNLNKEVKWNGKLSTTFKSNFNVTALKEANRKSLSEESNHLILNDSILFDEEDHFHDDHNHLTDGFCGQPNDQYGRVIIETEDVENSLLIVDNIQSLCEIDLVLRNSAEFKKICELKDGSECCPSWSLVNYLLHMNNKSSCKDLRKRDIKRFLNVLQLCLPTYENNHLRECLSNGISCKKVPKRCLKNSSVYNLLHYILDSGFKAKLHSFNSNSSEFALTIIAHFLPIAKSSKSLDYFLSLPSRIQKKNVIVTAIEFGLRETIFDIYLMKDIIYVGIGGIFIVLLIWIYTNSLLVALVVIFSIFLSMGVAFFIYSFVLSIQFFPFINCMAIIICLGIGVDDAFIFSRTWSLFHQDPKLSSYEIIRNSTLHAFKSMAITTITTAFALIITYCSKITAVKCFGIFSAICVMTHFVITFICLPSVLSCIAKTKRKLNDREIFSKKVKCFFKNFIKIEIFFQKLILKFLQTFSIVGILLSIAFFITSLSLIIYYYKELLGQSLHLKLLAKDNLFEKYTQKYASLFSFEEANLVDFRYSLPMKIVWGILPQDNGDYLDPADEGTLVFDNSFDITKRSSQQFIYDLCKEIKDQDFFKPNVGLHLSSCFIETFKNWMNRPCFDDVLNIHFSPCCKNATFPFHPQIFKECVPKALDEINKHNTQIYHGLKPGPVFSTTSGDILALVIEHETVFNFSLSYQHMKSFVDKIEYWLNSKLKNAPKGLENGWFISDFRYYDLQNELLKGALFSILAACLVSLVLIVFTTRSVILSLISIFCIFLIVAVVLTILILMGWTLDIFRIIIISVLIGLSVDYCIHFIISYNLAPVKNDRKTRINHSMKFVNGPVFMSFFTSFIAGCVMLNSKILVYIQIGYFMMILSSVSWIISAFILQSMLFMFGPVKNEDDSS